MTQFQRFHIHHARRKHREYKVHLSHQGVRFSCVCRVTSPQTRIFGAPRATGPFWKPGVLGCGTQAQQPCGCTPAHTIHVCVCGCFEGPPKKAPLGGRCALPRANSALCKKNGGLHPHTARVWGGNLLWGAAQHAHAHAHNTHPPGRITRGVTLAPHFSTRPAPFLPLPTPPIFPPSRAPRRPSRRPRSRTSSPWTCPSPRRT